MCPHALQAAHVPCQPHLCPRALPSSSVPTCPSSCPHTLSSSSVPTCPQKLFCALQPSSEPTCPTNCPHALTSSSVPRWLWRGQQNPAAASWDEGSTRRGTPPRVYKMTRVYEPMQMDSFHNTLAALWPEQASRKQGGPRASPNCRHRANRSGNTCGKASEVCNPIPTR